MAVVAEVATLETNWNKEFLRSGLFDTGRGATGRCCVAFELIGGSGSDGRAELVDGTPTERHVT